MIRQRGLTTRWAEPRGGPQEEEIFVPTVSYNSTLPRWRGEDRIERSRWMRLAGTSDGDDASFSNFPCLLATGDGLGRKEGRTPDRAVGS